MLCDAYLCDVKSVFKRSRPVCSTEQPQGEHYHEEPAMATGPDDDSARAFAKIAQDYPAWHAWPGTLAGVVYARRSRSSPPLVVRATTTDQLRREIENAERARGLR